MDISSLIVALVYIGILCIVAQLIVTLAPVPPPVPTIIWAIVAILCLLVLLDAIGGGHVLYYGHRHALAWYSHLHRIQWA